MIKDRVADVYDEEQRERGGGHTGGANGRQRRLAPVVAKGQRQNRQKLGS